MMKRSKSIRSKIAATILLISGGALGVGMLAIGINYYNISQQAMIENAEMQAQLVAKNTLFSDHLKKPEAISNLLKSVVINAPFSIAVFDNTGQILTRQGNGHEDFYISGSEFKSTESVLWGAQSLSVWSPIINQDKDFLGTVYLKISTVNFYSNIETFAVICLVIVLVLLIAVYLFSIRLQSMISEPLIELERISRKVSKSENYSIRVPSYGEDEIGSLARSFNQMLEAIEIKKKERDSADKELKLSKERLEVVVQDLQHLANYDSLTQLPNRALCIDRIDYSLKQASRTGSVVAILFLDLDHFKDVNDSLGHAVGDQLLKATSQRLLTQIREEDSLARFGGDEFVIILNSLHDSEDVIAVVEKIVASFEEPFRLSNYEVNTTASIGVCMYPNDGTDVDSLMKAADAAMYKAKEHGRNTYEFFEEELNHMAIRRHQLANELRQAIKNDELRIVFQPQLNLAKDKVLAAEVLIRWKHPLLGNISPAEFIPIAENTGLIKDIGAWLLDQSCQQIVACRKSGCEVRLAVNLSVMQFRQMNLPEQIAALLQHYHIPPKLLEVEITEGMLMRNITQAVDILERFKEMQVRVSIDDFGTGYSSLSYLRRFPLDALKIDSSFIDELVVNREDTEIVMAIISMANSLRIDVIAEGVETEQQFKFLKQNNCDDIQGYYFSEPLDKKAFIAFLKKRKAN